MTSRSSTEETPFNLTYGTEAVLPLGITSRSLRVTEFDANTNDVELRQNLDVLNEKREAAQLHQATYCYALGSRSRDRTYTCTSYSREYY